MVTLIGATLSADVAQGGDGGAGGFHRGFNPGRGGDGGDGLGGGVNVSAGTVGMLLVIVTGSSAQGGDSGPGGGGTPSGAPGTTGQGDGGGVDVFATDRGVGLDPFTRAHVKGNTASTLDPDIDGPFGPA
jgi:hypothetical protein